MFKDPIGPFLFGATLSIALFIPEWLIGTIGYKIPSLVMLHWIGAEIFAIGFLIAMFDPSLLHGYTYLVAPGFVFLIIGMQIESRAAVATILLMISISWIVMSGIYRIRRFTTRPRPLQRPWDAS